MPHPRQLIVETRDDCYAVIYLMKQYVDWPDRDVDWPVEIKIGRSVAEITNRDYMDPILKQSGLRILGIVLDADESSRRRWQGVRQLLGSRFPSMPRELPEEGLITQYEDGIKLGVWLMPDNRSSGMLETFLSFLVPAGSKKLWSYGKVAVQAAKRRGATFKEVHRHRAEIYTYLSWQDPPGRNFGIAISKRVLDTQSPAARVFAQWFQDLFEIPGKSDAG